MKCQKFSKVQIAEKVEQAKIFTMSKSQRWSAAKTRVLEVLLQQEKACTAYELLGLINKAGNKPLMPASIYRILDRFCDLTIAFRIDNRKAFYANKELEKGAPDIVMLCADCGCVNKISDEALNKKLKQTCKDSGFMVNNKVWTLQGRCSDCQSKAA